MSTFQLSVVSPDGKLYSGDVFALYVRGSDGDLAVLAGHAPLVTGRSAGVCRLSWKTATKSRSNARADY